MSRDRVIMVSKTCAVICFCIGLFLVIQTFLPKAFAYKRTSNVDEFMVEDKRTRMRQNYVVQRTMDNEMNDYDYGVPKYTLDAPAPAETEELPEFIVDYANMIRNNIILLDNSVETRTRKRGNINVEEHSQQRPDAPCICEGGAKRVDLSEGRGTVYPQSIYNVTCDQSLCRSSSHRCKERIIHVKILRMRDHPVYEKQLNNSVPDQLQFKWINDTIPVVTGCICMRSYLEKMTVAWDRSRH